MMNHTLEKFAKGFGVLVVLAVLVAVNGCASPTAPTAPSAPEVPRAPAAPEAPNAPGTGAPAPGAPTAPAEPTKPIGETPEPPGNAPAPFPPENPYQHWEAIGVEQLPKLTPDGRMQDFRLALQRLKQNCAEYRAGKFTTCLSESPLVTLSCDEATIEKMLELSAKHSSWDGYYKDAKAIFKWYRYKGGTSPSETLFTAYNAPTFEGSLKRDAKYSHPLYARPANLVDIKNPDGTIAWRKRLADGSLVPYDNRKAIDVDGLLKGQGLEIAWMEDPIDTWRLQLEGSGLLRVKGEDGAIVEMGANYAGKNGLPLISPIKYLKDKGVDKKYQSFAGMKLYVKDYPDELWPMLTSNPSYVFFSMNGEPPCSTSHAYLTQGHTLAVDPLHMPLATITLLESERPVDDADPAKPPIKKKKFARFAIAQDTGGPIKGAHVDIFFGFDDYAKLASDSMSAKGSIYMPRLR